MAVVSLHAHRDSFNYGKFNLTYNCSVLCRRLAEVVHLSFIHHASHVGDWDPVTAAANSANRYGGCIGQGIAHSYTMWRSQQNVYPRILRWKMQTGSPQLTNVTARLTALFRSSNATGALARLWTCQSLLAHATFQTLFLCNRRESDPCS